MRVLFCTDGSKISYHSIQNFACWATNFTVDILCAIDWSFLPDTVSVESSEFGNMCANSANSILEYSDKFLSELGFNIENKIKMCGAAVDCILEASQKKDYDCIILGSHGKKGIQKWLGSVSQEVASVADISTYISKEKNSCQKVLFAVDSTDMTYSAVVNCLDMYDFTAKEIELITVYEIPDYLFLEGNIDSNWILDIDKKQGTAASILLNKFEKLINDKGFCVSKKSVLSGTPAPEIIKYTAKNDIDLVVCGIHNRKYLSKFLLSSVSKRILESSKSDVLLIRP